MKEFHEGCRALAEEAHKMYSKQITPVIYLYGYEDRGRYTELKLSREMRVRYFDLVRPCHVPRHMTVDQLSEWFKSELRREPVLEAMGIDCSV